jgi:hypothetical protein
LVAQQTYKPTYDNFNPVSPAAYQFTKYSEHPVNEYTGIPEISVPIFNITEGEVNIPLKASYHAGGIRVSEEASWVGLGWDLSIGSITQTINDKDDYGQYAQGPYPKVLPDYFKNGFIGVLPLRYAYDNCFRPNGPGWTPTLAINTPDRAYGFMKATDHYFPLNGDYNQRRSYFFEYDEYDSEPDIFKASFLGHNLTFIRKFENQNDIINVLNKRGYKVIRNTTISPFGWDVLTPDGTKYSFAEMVESEVKSNTTDYNGITGSGSYQISGRTWMLTKITTRNKREIVIEYNKYGPFEQLPQLSQKLHHAGVISSNTLQPGNAAFTVNNLSSTMACSGICYSNTYTRIKEASIYISRIIFPNGEINFSLSDRLDMAGGKKLDKISINYKNENEIKELISEIEFNYDYYDASAVMSNGYTSGNGNYSGFENYNKYRLKLLNIKVNKTQVYSFSYNSNQLPKKNAFAQDYWGFYNGNPNNTSISPNPSRLGISGIGSNGDNHSPRLEYSKAGILEKIYYPTGGYSEFDYEMHVFKTFSNTNTPDYNGSISNTTSGYGLRIFEIRNYSNGAEQGSVRYTYEGGKNIQERVYFRRFSFKNVGSGGGFVICGTTNGFGQQFNTWNNFWEVSSASYYSSTPLGSINGVGYDKVIKKELDKSDNLANGYTETYFHNYYDITANSIGFGVEGNISLPTRKDHTKPTNGSIKEIKVFNSNNEILKRDTFSYTNLNSDIYYGVKVSFLGYLMGRVGTYYCGSDFNCVWDAIPQHLLGYYPIYDFDTKMYQKESYEYNGSISNYSRESYNYNSLGVLSGSGVFDGQHQFSYNYKRTADMVDPVATFMYSNNYLNDIWEYKAIKYVNNLYPPKDLDKYEVSYLKNGDVPLESTIKIFPKNLPLNSLPKQITYDLYNQNNHNLLEYTDNDNKSALIWGYNGKYVIAKVSNASSSDIAYSSFETNEKGNWVYNAASVLEQNAPIGKKVTILNVDGISKSGLNSAKDYIIRYWVKNSSAPLAVTGGLNRDGFPKLLKSNNAWSLYEHTIYGASGIQIQGAGKLIDDLKLFPANGLMTNYTYLPLVGLVSQTDATENTIYYEYDPSLRLKIIKDQNGNIVKQFCYNYAGQTINCNVQTFTNTQAYSGQFQKTGCTTGFVGSTVTYTVPIGTVTSIVSAADANILAQAKVNAEGQAYANANGTCTPSSSCTPSICQAQGQAYKCVAGVCEQGFQIFTGVEIMVNGVPHCEYYYEWSDLSRSYYSLPSGGSSCLMSF